MIAIVPIIMVTAGGHFGGAVGASVLFLLGMTTTAIGWRVLSSKRSNAIKAFALVALNTCAAGISFAVLSVAMPMLRAAMGHG